MQLKVIMQNHRLIQHNTTSCQCIIINTSKGMTFAVGYVQIHFAMLANPFENFYQHLPSRDVWLMHGDNPVLVHMRSGTKDDNLRDGGLVW